MHTKAQVLGCSGAAERTLAPCSAQGTQKASYWGAHKTHLIPSTRSIHNCPISLLISFLKLPRKSASLACTNHPNLHHELAHKQCHNPGTMQVANPTIPQPPAMLESRYSPGGKSWGTAPLLCPLEPTMDGSSSQQ